MAGGLDPYSAAGQHRNRRHSGSSTTDRSGDWSRRSASGCFRAGDAVRSCRGSVPEDDGARHRRPAGARDRHVHRLFGARDGRGASADGIVIACEIDAEVAAFAQRCFAASDSGHQVEVRLGPALSTLEGLARSDQEFDLIFIDADKAGYLAYLNVVLDTELLAPHGLICVDNTLMQGQPWMSAESTANGVAIDAFNRAVAADPRLEQVIIPLRDGLTLIRRATAD